MFIFEISQNRPGSIWICSRDNVQNMVGIMYILGLSRDNVQNIEKPTRSASSLRDDLVSWKQTRWAASFLFSSSVPRHKAKML